MAYLNTCDLIDTSLDYAVAKAIGMTWEPDTFRGDVYWDGVTIIKNWRPSVNWDQAGKIIDVMKIGIRPPRNTFAPNGYLVSPESDGWFATIYTYFEDQAMPSVSQFGPTPIIAAMRCYVLWKLGNKVQIPDDLIK